MTLTPSSVQMHHVCHDRDQASFALATRLAMVLRNAIAQRGTANLIVSGGTSPRRLYEILSEIELPWTKVNAMVSDERVVPADHADRNERMVQQCLKRARAVEINFISLFDRLEKEEGLLQQARSKLGQLNFPTDAVVLGMGNDGHTASLFPDCATIKRDLNTAQPCVIQRIPRLGQTRLSLTPKTLLNTQEINVLFFGETKREIFECAQRAGDQAKLPIRFALDQQQTVLNSYWAP